MRIALFAPILLAIFLMGASSQPRQAQGSSEAQIADSRINSYTAKFRGAHRTFLVGAITAECAGWFSFRRKYSTSSW